MAAPIAEAGSELSRRRHWDGVYRGSAPTGVSWYQAEAAVSLELVEELAPGPDARIVDVGGGASTFVDGLVERGFGDVTVLDLSEEALERARKRTGPEAATWLHQDLLSWEPTRHYDLWHDRAVFHFLTDAADRERYREVLNRALAPGGQIVLGTFAPSGPPSCSGLPVARYSSGELAEFLGAGFRVVRSLEESHVTPAGTVQPFTWIAARRVGQGGS